MFHFKLKDWVFIGLVIQCPITNATYLKLSLFDFPLIHEFSVSRLVVADAICKVQDMAMMSFTVFRCYVIKRKENWWYDYIKILSLKMSVATDIFSKNICQWYGQT